MPTYRFYPILIAMILMVWGGACREQVEDTLNPGVITVYTSLQEEYTKEAIDLFHAKNPGIRVNLVSDTEATLIDRLMAERDNPQADVIWGIDVTEVMFLEWRGLLKTYGPEGLYTPAGENRIRLLFRDPNDPPHWVGIGGLVIGICVNTVEMERLKLPMPASWKDLIKPVYKGHLVMPSPTTDAEGYLVISMLLQVDGEVEGWEYLKDLHDNIATYSNLYDESSQWVGAGKYPIGISDAHGSIIEKSKGNPVEMIFPAEGAAFDMEVNALIDKDSINPFAKNFLDWAISDEALKLHAKTRPVTSIATDEPRPDGFPTNLRDRIFDQDIPWMTANRKRIIKEWQAQYPDKSKSSN